MPITHVKSITAADGTDTNVVRGGDWNSNHQMVYNLVGNTINSSQAAGTDVQFGGGPGIALLGTGSTISIMEQHLSTYEPMPLAGVSSASQQVGSATASSNVLLFPFVIPKNITVGALNMIFSCSFVTVGTSSGRQSGGFHMGLYTRGIGASSTSMSQYDSTSFSYAVTASNSSYTINQATKTDFAGYTYSTTASAGSNISSGYTGLKLVGFPLSISMSPGNYWLAILGTNSSSSINCGISMHLVGGLASAAISLAPLGSYSSGFTIGSNPWADWNIGMGSVSTVGSYSNLPGTFGFTNITEGVVSCMPYMKFWST